MSSATTLGWFPPTLRRRSYEDLLQPRWKGQLGWDMEEYYLFGALMKARGKDKGLEFWRRLAEQQINFRKGYTLISELVSAGEFPVAVSLYQHRVDEYAEKGAPLQWVAPNPLVGGDPNKISLLKECAATQRGQTVSSTSCCRRKVKSCCRIKVEVRGESAWARRILVSKERRFLPCT